jgi:hypothetical protein
MCDTRDLVRIVTKTAKQNSSIGLHIKKLVKAGGQGGVAKLRSLAQSMGGDATPPPDGPKNEQAQYEKLAGGGAIIYTDENGDAKFITPESPSPLVEPFIRDVLMRDGLSSLGGAGSDFFWACADLSGAGQRFVIEKAGYFFEIMGDSEIGHLCSPWITRYLQHRIETGKLRRPLKRVCTPPTPASLTADPETEAVETWVEDVDDEWMNHVEFQLPGQMSIDRGDALAEIAQLASGVETLDSVNSRRGRGWRHMVKQWFREFAYAQQIAKAMKAEWALKLWRAGMPGAGGAAPAAVDPSQEDVVDPAAEKKKKEAA